MTAIRVILIIACSRLAVLIIATTCSISPTVAQVVLDGTTGPAGALPGPDYAIRAELGRRAGPNLFHSFERFGLRTGESATFFGPDGIANVISRVTGGERSDIDGTLRSTIPGAALWFLNPAGVAFGPNARLDVPGSFHVSTADELRFADGATFSATDPTASTFTVAAPEAFGFLGAEPAGLLVDRSRLGVPAGEALSLVGGDVTLTAGNNGLASEGEDGTIRAEAGRITLAALGGSGEVPVTGGEITGRVFADVHLTDQALVDVSGNGGGTVRVRSGRFVVANGSSVFAGNTGVIDATSGIDVQAEAVSVAGGSVIAANIFGSGAGGTLTVQTEQLAVLDGGEIEAVSFDGGAGGAVLIEAREAFVVSSKSVVSAETFGAGPGGDIIVRTPSLEVNNGFIGAGSREGAAETADAGSVIIDSDSVKFLNEGRVFNGTDGAGDGGDIVVTADTLTADATADHPTRFHTGLSASANQGSTGRGGDITVNAREIRLIHGGEISSSTRGTGAGGSTNIDAANLYVNNGFIGSDTQGPADTADGGSVVITGGRVEFLNEGRIFNGTGGPGDGGDIIVTAATLLADATPIDHEPRFHTGISASANRGSMGRGGDVTVSAREIRLANGGQISSDTDGDGAGGDVVVIARERLLVSGVDPRGSPERGVFASSGNPDSGAPGGAVLVSAPAIAIADGGQIASSSEGRGVAGTVSIGNGDVRAVEVHRDDELIGVVAVPATEVLRMSGDASITAETARADAGDIRISVRSLIDMQDSEITTSAAGGRGGGGNIAIDPRFVVLDNSRIAADAFEGRGGNVTIEADNLIRSPNSVVSASSRLGLPGRVAISAPDEDVSSGLVALPTVFLDASALLPESCAARRSEDLSSFTAAGWGGLPPDPDAPLPGFYTLHPGTPGAPAAAAAPARGRMAGVEPTESAAPLPPRKTCTAW